MTIINLDQFKTHLNKQPLKQVYLLASDVMLLRQEARDALRAAAIQQGLIERETHYVDRDFSWNQFFSALQNLNLFSEKTVIELQHPTAKFDPKSLDKLLHYLKNPAPGRLLLIITNKLTTSQQKTRWYNAVNDSGLILQIPNVSEAQLPQWIKQRAQQLQLSLNTESMKSLATLTTGNLLATQQALQKLALLYPKQLITSSEIISVMSDSANFNVFDLSHCMLTGNTAQSLRVLQGLLNNNVECTIILWLITRELRQLLQLMQQQRQGTPLVTLLQKQRQAQRPLLQKAMMRLNAKKLNQLLANAAIVDRAIKGLHPEKPSDLLEMMVISFCDETNNHA